MVLGAFKSILRKKNQSNPTSPVMPTSPVNHAEQERARHFNEYAPTKNDQSYQQQHQQKQPNPTIEVTRQNNSNPEDYKSEANRIIHRSNEAKSKMPVYEGLERYSLQEKMGDGAFSNVYKALDLKTNKLVAVKIVRKYEMNHNQYLNTDFKHRPRVTEKANIEKEVHIMRQLSSENIISLIEFQESRDYYYLVLELMAGGELFHQIVKLTYFSEDLSRHVILQVAEGIRHLHIDKGVVHRDIKPENLLFERIPIIPSKNPVKRQYDEEKEDEGEFTPGVGGGGIGKVKIADFGLSKIVWNENTMTPCGTVGYTAPEIVKDERYSMSVDMWALGCVLYTLLCGFPPFFDESVHVLTEKVARGYFTFLSPWWDDISDSAKDLITHLLCVDPEQRYDINQFLNHPWCKPTVYQSPPHKPKPQPAYVGLDNNLPVDSPLMDSLRNGRRAMASPGVSQLKEAFDVTYAVKRMEEEGARRKNLPGGVGLRSKLHGLNEEAEEDEATQFARTHPEGPANDAIRNIQAASAQKNIKARGGNPTAEPQRYIGYGGVTDRRAAEMELYGGRAGSRDQGNRRGPFELNMNGATLLGRRQAIGKPSPLGGNLRGAASPMHIDVNA